MRGLVRVGAAVPSLALGNVKENMKRHLAMMREAKEKHVSIVTFPELSLTGYTCGDLFFQRRLLDDVTDALLALKDEMPEEILAVVGAPLEIEGALYNCAVVLHKGEIISAVPKTFLPNNGEFYEKRWFQSGDARRDASVAIPKLKTDVCLRQYLKRRTACASASSCARICGRRCRRARCCPLKARKSS